MLITGGCRLPLDGVMAEASSGGTASAAAVIGGGDDASAPGLGPTGATAGASAEIIVSQMPPLVSAVVLLLISGRCDEELGNTMNAAVWVGW